MLLEDLVVNQRAVGRVRLSLSCQRGRGGLEAKPRVARSRRGHRGSVVEGVGVLPGVQALNGSLLLRFAPQFRQTRPPHRGVPLWAFGRPLGSVFHPVPPADRLPVGPGQPRRWAAGWSGGFQLPAGV